MRRMGHAWLSSVHSQQETALKHLLQCDIEEAMLDILYLAAMIDMPADLSVEQSHQGLPAANVNGAVVCSSCATA